MAGENIPIDYLSDHLTCFDLVITFTPGKGYKGSIIMDGTKVHQTNLTPEPQHAFDELCQQLEQNSHILCDNV